MRLFAAFVIVTLLAESVFAGFYADSFRQPVALVAFYLIMGIVSYARARTALMLFQPSRPVLVFCSIQAVSVLTCVIMTMVTGVALMAIIGGWMTPALASVYNAAYSGFSGASIALSVGEIISLFLRRGSRNVNRRHIADALRVVFAVPSVLSNRRIEV